MFVLFLDHKINKRECLRLQRAFINSLKNIFCTKFVGELREKY